MLAKLASSSPEHILPASLLRAQTAAAAGNLRGGVAVLQELNAGPLAHRPGVVASVVGLLVHVGEAEEAEGVLQAALQHWQGQTGSDERYASDLCCSCCHTCIIVTHDFKMLLQDGGVAVAFAAACKPQAQDR